MQETQPTGRFHSWGKKTVLLVLVWAWLYLPFLGSGELEREEGHRAIPAQEMWDRSDWVLPTYLNEPYLKKPPGFYWMVMGVSLPFGEVTQWSLRLTSALGTLAGAFLVGLWSREWLGGGFAAAIVFLVTPETWMKGTLGEIDGPFSVLVLASGYAFWKSTRDPLGLGWALLSGLIMAWAILTKGPIAILFFYLGFGLWFLWDGKLAAFFGVRQFVFLLATAFPVLLWFSLLCRSIPMEELLAIWGSEMGQTRASEQMWDEMKRVAVFPIAIVLAYLPGFVKLWEVGLNPPLAAPKKSLWRLAVALSFPMFFLLILHGRRVRYTLPGGVFLSLLWAIPSDHRWVKALFRPRFASACVFVMGLAHAGFMWFDSQQSFQADIANQFNQHVEKGEVLLTDLDGDYIGLPFYLHGCHDEIEASEEIPSEQSKALVYTDSLGQYPSSKTIILTVAPKGWPSLTLIEIGEKA